MTGTKDRSNVPKATRYSRITQFSNIHNKRYEEYVLSTLKHKIFSIPRPLLEELEWQKELGVRASEITRVIENLICGSYKIANKVWIVPISSYSYLFADLTKEPNLKKIKQDEAIIILENLLRHFMDNKDLSSLKTTINFIHNYLRYFTTKSDLFVEYYQKELYNAYAESLRLNFGVSKTEEQIIRFNKERLNEVTELLTRNTVKTVRVWLMRELYYMVNAMEQYLAEQEELIALKALFDGNKVLFDKILGKHRERSFGCTNPEIYFGVVRDFHNALQLPKAAQFNALLNIAHCNGNMSSKFIKVSDNYSPNEFLTRLSDGKYTQGVKSLFCKDLDISPALL